jgi:hypothetical protein
LALHLDLHLEVFVPKKKEMGWVGAAVATMMLFLFLHKASRISLAKR